MGGAGLKKYEHEWYSDKINQVSVINFHDKKHITLISSVSHGSEMGVVDRTRNGSRKEVDIPAMVKSYSYKKVGVDVGDQKLRSKLAYADTIRCKGWNRKWGMYAVQQIRHNAYLSWLDVNEIMDRSE